MRKKFWKYDYALVRADARYLPIADKRFDFVFSSGVLHHSPNIAKAISEISRVAKQGARVTLMLYNKWSAFVLAYKIIRLLRLSEMTFAEFTDGPGNIRSDAFARADLKKMLQAAGIKSVSYRLGFQPFVMHTFLLEFAAIHARSLTIRIVARRLSYLFSKVRARSLLRQRFFGFYMYAFGIVQGRSDRTG